jgi:hypothetical protein
VDRPGLPNQRSDRRERSPLIYHNPNPSRQGADAASDLLRNSERYPRMGGGYGSYSGCTQALPPLRLTQLLHSEAQPRAFALNRLAVVIDRIARNAAFEENRKPNFRYCDLLASDIKRNAHSLTRVGNRRLAATFQFLVGERTQLSRPV